MAPPVPFIREDQLVTEDHLETVPGHPYLKLSNSASVSRFLQLELSTERLRDVYSILFLTSKPRNISPLHHQALKGRKIIITEQADLHLVTYPGRILIKPLPLWLLSSSFYESQLVHPRQGVGDLAGEAHGFLRTYASLIQHESDLYIAKKEKLIPPSINLKWDAWCRFINQLKYPFKVSSERVEIAARKSRNSGEALLVDAVPLYSDSLVSPRYHYGEIGLIRLNLWCFLTFREWEYLPVHYDYAAYFARYLAPCLFVFGALTVVLSAMQVDIAAHPMDSTYIRYSSRFVGMTVCLTIMSCVFFPALYLFFAVRELYYYFVYFRPQL
ncbi:hypothetical protein F5883DRAFT_569325 [Diaporthe sp. PMI_573]|nr:hypothetical protein F5883DRAFT_569325 [Diaporthaceae sp. PMI_573]